MDTASNCEAYMSRLLRKDKTASMTSGLKSNISAVKAKSNSNKYSTRTKSSARSQNSQLHNNPKSSGPTVTTTHFSKVDGNLNLHKELYIENPSMEMSAKTSKPRSRSSAAGDREPWAKLLQASTDKSSKFSNFDPLRTLHFLAKELQYKLQNDLSDEDSLQQIISDIQNALARVPPEIASVIKLNNSPDKVNFRRSSSSNSLLHMKPCSEKRKTPKISQSCQTIQKQEDAELIQKIMEGSTLKLEASCRQMEMLCGRLKSEKEDLEEQLKTERENTKFLKKRVGDLEVQCDQLVSVTIKRLEEEKNELQLQVNKLTDVVDSQSVHTSYELKNANQELKQLQMRAEQELNKMKHQLALANMEREKYIAILTVRDKQINEIRAEMSQLQDVVNEQLMDIHNNALNDLPNSNSFNTENGWVDEHSKSIDDIENNSNMTLSSGENQLIVPTENLDIAGKPGIACDEDVLDKKDLRNTPGHKLSIRNMFAELKKQAFAVTSTTLIKS